MSAAARISELNALRSEVVSLRALSSLYDKVDAGQRRMATRILAAIDTRIEELDHVDCFSEDLIDEGVRA